MTRPISKKSSASATFEARAADYPSSRTSRPVLLSFIDAEPDSRFWTVSIRNGPTRAPAANYFARREGQSLIKKTPAGRGPAGGGLGLERGSSPSQGAEGRIGRGRCGETTSPSENG